MSIHIDVVAELNKQATQRASQQIQREFTKTAQNAGKDFDKILAENMTGGMSKFTKQMDRAVDATAKLRGEEARLTDARKQAKAATDARSSAEERLQKAIEATGKGSRDAVAVEKELSSLRKQEQRNLAALEAQSRKVAAARRDEARAARDAANAMGGSDDGGGIGFGGGRRGGGRWASPGIVHAATLGVGAMPAAALAATNLAGALQQLSGAGLAIPGIFAGIGASVGTAALGMSGMSDAFDAVAKASDGTKASVEAANKALAELSPQAAEVIKTTYGLKGTFTELRDLAAGNMFEGVSDGMKELAGNLLPSVTKGIDGISRGLNKNILQLFDSLGSESSQGILDRIFGNTADAQNRFTKAIDPIIEGIGTLAAAGSDSLPRLADAVGAVADRFNAFITGADADGRLSTWIDEGLDGFTNLGNSLLNVGTSLTAITQAAGGSGGFLESLESGTRKISEFLNSADGQQKLAAFFEEGRVMAGKLMETARELGPVLKGAFDAAHEAAGVLLPIIREVLDLINAIPGGAETVVGAFIGWKTIQGVSSLATSLASISNLLGVGLPSAAGKGAAGISAALSRVAVPAWLAYMVGQQNPVFNNQEVNAAVNEAANGNQQPLQDVFKRVEQDMGNVGPFAPRYSSSGSFGPPAILQPDGTFGSGSLGGPAGASAERRPRPPAAPGPEVPGVSGWTDPVITEPGGGVSDSDRRAAIRAGLNPGAFAVDPFSAMAQVPGFQPGYGNQDQIQAQQRAQSEAWDVQEAAMDLEVLKLDSLSTQQEINDAQRKLTEEGWQLENAQADLLKSMTGKSKEFADGLGDIGAQLDSDLGISKGLPGIADNIVRFVASLAAAPLLGPLAAISNANPNQGSGIIGMMASNGVFGEQYTPGAIAAAGNSGTFNSTYGPSNMGPAALRPSGVYPGDQALLANVPAGRYTQSERGDLTQGLADCSSAVEDLVNLLDGKSTKGASMSTGNADQWLQERGFLPGKGGLGDMRVGFNSGHMQATLPGGTPFNWGSDSAAARGGVGGTGADDPAFTSHYYRPAGVTSGTPGLYSPENTNPSLTPASGGGSGSLFGIPIPQSPVGQLPHLPGSVGQSAMPGANGQGLTGVGASANPAAGMSSFNAGQQPTGGTGGGAQGLSGAPMDALMGAAGMADMLAPGAGAAAQIGMKLANRAIGQMGQYAGIGVSGLMETLSVGNTPLSNPSKSWLGKLAGGFAGARPNLPNSAGGVGGNQAEQKPKDNPNRSEHQGSGQAPGPTNGVYIEQYNVGETEDRAGADLARHQQAGALAAMPRR